MLPVLFIYLAEISKKLHIYMFLMLIILMLLIIVVVIFKFVAAVDSINQSDNLQNVKELDKVILTGSILKKLMIISIIVSCVKILLPNEKTLYIMAGAYIGTEIVTSKIALEKIEKINTIIDLKLDEIIKEYKNEYK